MDDYVVGVDQHPVCCWKPLDPRRSPKSLFYLVGKLNGHRRDLSRRAPRGDDHMVGDARLAGERDGHDLLRLVVIERLKDEFVEVFDVFGSATVRGGLSDFCQVVS